MSTLAKPSRLKRRLSGPAPHALEPQRLPATPARTATFMGTTASNFAGNDNLITPLLPFRPNKNHRVSRRTMPIAFTVPCINPSDDQLGLQLPLEQYRHRHDTHVGSLVYFTIHPVPIRT